MSKSYAIVVQCFIKLDLLLGLVESLQKIPEIDQFDLIFWQDNPIGSKYYNEKNTMDNFNKVKSYVLGVLPYFPRAIYKSNEINMGPYMTCKIAMDYAFIEHDYVIFTEDDTIFTKDSLKFFISLYRNKHLNDPNIMGIGGESIFFDSQKQRVTQETVDIFDEMRNVLSLDKYYTYFDFMPSTCFATTKEKWSLFGAIRGEPVGDVALCKYVKNNNYKVIFPITAKVADLGMQHPLGYAVTVQGLDQVSEVKNTYLLSKGDATVDYVEFCFNRDKLYYMSVMMNVPVLNEPSSTRTFDFFKNILS